MKLLFIDLETTGTRYWKDGIHQMSGCIDIDGEIKESFNFFVRPNPNAQINEVALSVGHVTLEQVQAYPPMEEIYAKFVKMLSKYVNKFDKTDKFYIVGFNNASFDNSFLQAFFKQNGDDYYGSWFWPNSLDTYVLVTPLLASIRSTMPNFKLSTVATYLGIDVIESRLHDAEYDIELTRGVYYKYLELSKFQPILVNAQ